MRDKQPLALLQALAKKAEPARDFKAAILEKAQQTGGWREQTSVSVGVAEGGWQHWSPRASAETGSCVKHGTAIRRSPSRARHARPC